MARTLAVLAITSSLWACDSPLFNPLPPPKPPPTNSCTVGAAELTVTLEGDTVVLTWVHDGAADGFNLARAVEDGRFEPLGDALAADVRRFEDNDNLALDTEYTYRVVTLGAGCTGDDAASRPMTVTTRPNPVTLYPSSSVVAGQSQIDLMWMDANNDQTRSFRVERRLFSDADFSGVSLAENWATSPYSDTTVAFDTEYVYRVTVVGVNGESDPQTVAQWASPYPPDVTVTVVASGSLRISWTDDNVNHTGYRLTRDGSGMAPTGPTVKEVIDTGLEPGTLYTYQVWAIGPTNVESEGGGSGTTPSNPVVDFATDISLDASCDLHATGEVLSYDPLASFDHATGWTDASGYTLASANESGLIFTTSGFPAASNATLSWTVTDSLGGSVTGSDSFSISDTQAMRSSAHLPDPSTGDFSPMEGAQPLWEDALTGCVERTNCVPAVPGMIQAGDGFTCAFMANPVASLQCWGDPGEGRLASNCGLPCDTDPPNTTPGSPCDSAGTWGACSDVSSNGFALGRAHTCIILDQSRNFRVACWGAGTLGQLGDNLGISRSYVFLADQLVVTWDGSQVNDVKAIVAGDDHTCLLCDDSGSLCDHEVLCWGDNEFGQVGNPTADPAPNARFVCINPAGDEGCASERLSNVYALAAGSNHTCALKANGEVWCWGDNASHQVGADASTVPATTVPLPVCESAWAIYPDGCTTTPAVSSATAITAGDQHTCVIRDSEVWCWGRNNWGQLGRGDAVGARPVCASGTDPSICPRLTDVVAIAAGGASTCALLESGEVRCWGSNDHGQLGDGTQNQRASPTPVCLSGFWNGSACDDGGFGNGELLTGAVAITVGTDHSCALIGDASSGTVTTRVRCWGANDRGQLGDGATSSDRLNASVVCTNGIWDQSNGCGMAGTVWQPGVKHCPGFTVP